MLTNVTRQQGFPEGAGQNKQEIHLTREGDESARCLWFTQRRLPGI